MPKRMLFDLRSAVEANLSQIFALYADDTGKLQEMLTTASTAGAPQLPGSGPDAASGMGHQ